MARLNCSAGKRKSQQWTPIYMIIVIAIVVVLLLTFVKPLFQQASAASDKSLSTAKDVLGFIPLAFS